MEIKLRLKLTIQQPIFQQVYFTLLAGSGNLTWLPKTAARNAFASA
jgi:hypothetical protein